MKLFGIGSARDYARRVADRLGVPVALVEERDFEDGEFKIRPLESVRGERVMVFATLAGDTVRSVSDRLCRLWLFSGALVDAGAAHVTAFVPYLAFSRKDRRTQPRDPIATSLVARLFEASGIQAIATFDPHNASAFENAFRCPKEHFECGPLFAEHFAPLARDAEKVAVLSPDTGGVKRARAFASLLEERSQRAVALAFMEKYRSAGQVSGELFAGDVADALVIVYDDLIASGTTVARAASACLARGARAVHAAVTHALLTGSAAETVGGCGLASLVVTDTVGDVGRRLGALGALRVDVLDSTSLAAGAVAHWDETLR